MAKNKLKCPDCGYQSFPTISGGLADGILELKDVDIVADDGLPGFEKFVWTEHWTCPDCGKVFEVKNANY